MADSQGLIDALLGNHLARLSDNELKRTARRKLYGDNLEAMNQGLIQQVKGTNERFADNGLAQSGIALDALTNVQKANETAQSRLSDNFNQDLGQLGIDDANSNQSYELGVDQYHRSDALQNAQDAALAAANAAQNVDQGTPPDPTQAQIDYSNAAQAWADAVNANANYTPPKVYSPTPVTPPTNPTTLARKAVQQGTGYNRLKYTVV